LHSRTPVQERFQMKTACHSLAPPLSSQERLLEPLPILMAEAANEGKISGGIAAAKTYFDNGIIANFEFNGLSSGGSYAGGFSFANQADARQKIATQMWIALFGQGFETWTEWRRTGIPALTPAVEAGISTIPTRMFYPTTQVSLNKDNYDTAKGMLNNGDNLDSKLFWTL
jgi:hypothetical protein